MPTLKLTKMPVREIRYDCDLRYIGPATPERRTDAPAPAERYDAEPSTERIDTKRMLDALEDDKAPFDFERFMYALAEERRDPGITRVDSTPEVLRIDPRETDVLGVGTRQARDRQTRIHNEEWQRRYDAARAYLKSPIRACELDYRHRKYPWEKS
jgi:hypothetical protein